MDDLAARPALEGFARHLHACNNTVLPGGRPVLRLAGAPVGYVSAAAAASLDLGPDDVDVPDPEALARLEERIVAAGLAARRGERFDVRATEDGPVLATLDRGVLPALGVRATGVHMNGLVEQGGAAFLWVARRAADKLLDPGKLDHLAAGGVSAGMTADETMLKEAGEECGLVGDLAGTIRPVGVIRYVMERPEGLRRDVLRCYDVLLPPEWRPQPLDGEVEAFELWKLEQVFEAVRTGEAFKFNVNLVLLDLFLRQGLLPDDGTLRRGLERSLI